MKLCLCSLFSVTLKKAEYLHHYLIIQHVKTQFKACRHVWEGTNLYKTVHSNTSKKKPQNAYMCRRVVILIRALNMHGNTESFTGLCPLSCTTAAVGPVSKKEWGKEQSHLGDRIVWQSAGSKVLSRFTVSNTFSVTVTAEKRSDSKSKNMFNLQLPAFNSVPPALS